MQDGRISNNLLLMTTAPLTLEQLSFENSESWFEFHRSFIELREQLGLSQAALAERLGVSQPAVAQFERINYMPTITTVLAYAHALGLRLSFSSEGLELTD
jgi:DNA-binding XRE family transcriptional regulator